LLSARIHVGFRWVPERNGQIDAPTEIVGPAAKQTTTPDPFGASPAALTEQVERLQRRTDALEQQLEAERERRAAAEAAFERQRGESRRLYEESARLRTELEQGDHQMPPPAWADRPVNPALRTKWRWILRALALLVLVIVLGAVYLLVHAYITHESIQHVWSQVRNTV
jgi:hypothetical protein